MLEQIQQHQAVDVGQAKIERDHMRLQLARQRQSAGARGSHHALEAGFPGNVQQDGGEVFGARVSGVGRFGL